MIRCFFSGLVVVILITILNSCSHVVYKEEFHVIAGGYNTISLEEPDTADLIIKSKPDLITQLYEKSEKFLSEMWKSRQNIEQMLFVLRNVYRDGLHPEDYHLSAIENLVKKIIWSNEVDSSDIARLELMLTNSFLILSEHLAVGKIDEETIDPQWKASRRTATLNWETFTDSTLQKNKIIENLQKLTPGNREYNNLKRALATYRQISEKGGWNKFMTTEPKLERGMWHPDIALLRKRFDITQEYIENNADERSFFDESLHEQVVLFQIRNGLTADGVVGKSTIDAMNITVEERIASIEANLERWRWLSDDLGDRYISVNIANFELQVIENDTIVFSTKAIVGVNIRKTPVFSSLMTYLVLNPDWTVPPTIFKSDIIPSVINNPDYLKEKSLKILRSDGTEVDPLSIDWNKVSANGFPYRVHQEPGPKNALGMVKFMFPNQYSVYIHDTPNHNLFRQTDRSLSSGCIRVNNPLELVAWLMKDNPDWSPDEINNIISKGRLQTVNLTIPIQVHILYFTAWASNDAVVYFRKDIYDFDQQLLAALKMVVPETY